MLLTPQKASATESYGHFWVGDVQYYFEIDYEDFCYAILTAFKPEVTGHVVIPETFDFNAGGGVKTWTVTGVATGAFKFANVTSVDLPASIYSVMEESFVNSENLKYIIIRATVPPVVYNNQWQEMSDTQLFNTMVFKGVYVPDGSLQAYKDDTNWGQAKIYPISEYQGIESIQSSAVSIQKVLIDGTLYIAMPDGKVYTIQGVRVR